ncbi:MAG: glyoxalase [Symploca sp. SIO2E9]|nr:glyoxalase [Symploca sp. SIO2E9]
MLNISSEQILSTSSLSTKEVNDSLSKYSRNQINNSEQLERVDKSVSNPFHLSMCVNDLESTRNFYRNILGIEERRASRKSAHFDFYGCQLTVHEVPGYSAKNLQREVDAEDVPVPHFGAALSFEEFKKTKERLIAHGIKFLKKPRLRFVGKGHEQYVMFLEDPSGHGIEIKSFTRVNPGNWA